MEQDGMLAALGKGGLFHSPSVRWPSLVCWQKVWKDIFVGEII